MSTEISIEFFPPTTAEGAEKLRATCEKLAALKPAFFSVTYGAGGSTDVGDVSWVAPTAMITVACEPQGTPPHSWQWVANGKSSAAHKGMLVAGKSIAMTAYDLLTRPELLEAAAAEQVQNLNGENYHSIIPDGTLPR